jgi:hypothetical protein
MFAFGNDVPVAEPLLAITLRLLLDDRERVADLEETTRNESSQQLDVYTVETNPPPFPI